MKSHSGVATRFETREVLAAAYRENAPATMLSHTVDAETEIPLCRRVKAASIADSSAGDINAAPTCPVCRRRDARFPAEA